MRSRESGLPAFARAPATDVGARPAPPSARPPASCPSASGTSPRTAAATLDASVALPPGSRPTVTADHLHVHDAGRSQGPASRFDEFRLALEITRRASPPAPLRDSSEPRPRRDEGRPHQLEQPRTSSPRPVAGRRSGPGRSATGGFSQANRRWSPGTKRSVGTAAIASRTLWVPDLDRQLSRSADPAQYPRLSASLPAESLHLEPR